MAPVRASAARSRSSIELPPPPGRSPAGQPRRALLPPVLSLPPPLSSNPSPSGSSPGDLSRRPISSLAPSQASSSMGMVFPCSDPAVPRLADVLSAPQARRCRGSAALPWPRPGARRRTGPSVASLCLLTTSSRVGRSPPAPPTQPPRTASPPVRFARAAGPAPAFPSPASLRPRPSAPPAASRGLARPSSAPAIPPPAGPRPMSTESVRSVRIRSTMLARLLHGFVLLPSGISDDGATET